MTRSDRMACFRVVTIAGWVLFTFCASSPSLAQTQAGPRVIQYSTPTIGKLRLDTFPKLDLGGTGGIEFDDVSAIRIRSDGGIVVANSGSKLVRLFDGAGRLLKEVGRGGQGPGEYLEIWDIGLFAGDSIVVLDRLSRRLSLLAPDGGFVRSISLLPPFEGGGTPTNLVALADGTLLVGFSLIERMQPQPNAKYFGQRVFRYGPKAEPSAKEGFLLPDREFFVQQTPPAMGGVAYWNLAFGRVMSLRGFGEGLLTGDGTDWSVERRSIDGKVLEVHRVPLPVVPVTAADRAAFIAREVTSKQPQQRAVEERMAAEMPWPKTKPAYRRIEPSAAGQIWIESYERGADGASRWIRLDPSTQTAAEVQLPPRFRAMTFTQRAIYGVWRDPDDVEHLRTYALVPE